MSPTATIDKAALRSLLLSNAPLNDLRDLLASWVRRGATRDQLRQVLVSARSELAPERGDEIEDSILEALDIVEDWSSPHLRLPFSESDGRPDQTLESSDAGESDATILIPLSDEFIRIRDDLLCPALTDLGLEVRLPAKEITEPNALFELVADLVHSSVVVIDLTGLDSLMLYALGVAQALSRPAIILTQDIEELPFDLRTYDVLAYSTRLDKIGELKNELRKAVAGLIDRDLPFRNPVSDLTGVIPASDVEESDEETDELPGIFDLLPAALAAMGGVNSTTVEFNALTQQLSATFEAQTSEVTAAAGRSGPGAYARQVRMIKVVTAHLDNYADQGNSLLPSYRAQWKSIAEDTLGWVQLVTVNSDEDAQAARTFTDQLLELRQTIETSATSIGGMRDAARNLRGQKLSKDLNRALRRVESLLDDWIEVILTGASQLERTRTVLRDRIDRAPPVD